MLRRRVDRDEAQRRVAEGSEVVSRPGVDENEVVRSDLARLAVEHRLGASVDEREDLVGRRMNLLADLAARRDRHDDDLLVLPGEEHAPEGVVRPGSSGDVRADRCRHHHTSVRKPQAESAPVPRPAAAMLRL
jgi:hypothetical protein